MWELQRIRAHSRWNRLLIDIVHEVVERNKILFSQKEFLSLDARFDPLPKSDIIFIRQVLQHLSNADIERLIDNCLKSSNLLLIIEPVLPLMMPNLDIKTGRRTRDSRRRAL